MRLFPIQNDNYFSLLCEAEIVAEITTHTLPKSSKLDHNLCRYAAHLWSWADQVDEEADLSLAQPRNMMKSEYEGAPEQSGRDEDDEDDFRLRLDHRRSGRTTE